MIGDASDVFCYQINFTEFQSWGHDSLVNKFSVVPTLRCGMARVPEDERLFIVKLYTNEYSQHAVTAVVNRPLNTATVLM